MDMESSDAAQNKLAEKIEYHLSSIQQLIKDAGYKQAMITIELPKDLYSMLIDGYTSKYRKGYGVEDIDEFTLYGTFTFSRRPE